MAFKYENSSNKKHLALSAVQIDLCMITAIWDERMVVVSLASYSNREERRTHSDTLCRLQLVSEAPAVLWGPRQVFFLPRGRERGGDVIGDGRGLGGQFLHWVVFTVLRLWPSSVAVAVIKSIVTDKPVGGREWVMLHWFCRHNRLFLPLFTLSLSVSIPLFFSLSVFISLSCCLYGSSLFCISLSLS